VTADSHNAPLGSVEYGELVGRVTATVAETVPPGASLLIVSKGDAALLGMPGFSTAHFPQGQGGDYAGYHPADSESATAELERLRREGAEYLVIPATARWWLDYYGDFATHLANHGEVLADVPDACLIYRLGGLRGSAAGVPALTKPVASQEQLRDYLERLIPAESGVVLFDAADVAIAALAPLHVRRLLPEEVGEDSGEDLLTVLRELAESGADYFVVPRSADEWLDRHAEPATEMEAACRKVADQGHLCRVFELDGLKEGG
jgi:hypothetical protein